MNIPQSSNSDRNRGQVGIGTLIVFIALVLVAAIAAGVLINTAGFLQSQAESTGQDSTDQVSDQLQVVEVYGTGTAGSPGSVSSLTVEIQLAPGADIVSADSVSADIIAGSSTGTGSVDFGDGTLEQGETGTINSFGVSLDGGNEASVIIRNEASASQLRYQFSAPNPISNSGDIRLDQ